MCFVLQVLVAMGFFIPLAEIGGRALGGLRQLSWFALSWGVTGVASHVLCHVLIFFVLSPPLTLGYSSSTSNALNLTSFATAPSSSGTSGTTPLYSRLFWIVLTTGTFIAVPIVANVVLLVYKAFDGDHFTDISSSWSVKVAVSGQLLVWCWFVLLCHYNLFIGVWSIAVYVVLLCGGLFVVSVLFPGIGLSEQLNQTCWGNGRHLLTVAMALIPFIPLVVQLAPLLIATTTTSPTSSTSTAATSTASTSSSRGGGSDQAYTAFVTSACVVNLMHWIWGNGLVAIITLLRETSTVWCTPTIFPVYGWDASLGEQGQLIEKNSGLAHCFVALGEIVVLCLLGTFFAYPVHFYGTFMLYCCVSVLSMLYFYVSVFMCRCFFVGVLDVCAMVVWSDSQYCTFLCSVKIKMIKNQQWSKICLVKNNNGQKQ